MTDLMTLDLAPNIAVQSDDLNRDPENQVPDATTPDVATGLPRGPGISSGSWSPRRPTVEIEYESSLVENPLRVDAPETSGKSIADRFRAFIPFSIQQDLSTSMPVEGSRHSISPLTRALQTQTDEADTNTSAVGQVPTLQARPVEKSHQRQAGVPVSNASHQPDASRATIVPDSGQGLFIPPSAIQTVPAVGPDREPQAFPGFPGIPAPHSESLKPRSAKPDSGEVIR